MVQAFTKRQELKDKRREPEVSNDESRNANDAGPRIALCIPIGRWNTRDQHGTSANSFFAPPATRATVSTQAQRF